MSDETSDERRGGADDPQDWTPETYRRVIDNAGVGLFQTRLDGRYVFANETLARMLGYPDQQALFAEDPKVGERFYADASQRAEFQSLMARDGAVYDYLIQCRRRDGSLFWVSETSNVLRGPGRDVIGYAGALIDVTRRVQAEHGFRALFDTMTEGVVRSTPDGRVLRANPAFVQMMGFESEQALIDAVENLGRQFYVDPTRRTAFMERMAADGGVEDFQSDVYRIATGERMWVSESVRAVHDDHGALQYYEGTVTDVTERREALAVLTQAKEAAEAASRAKSRFLANVSHELRTPLNSIIGFSDLIGAEIFGPVGSEKYRSYITDIHSSASMLLQLIDDILDIAKHEAGKLNIEPQAIRADQVLEQAVRLLIPRADGAGVDLAVDGAPPALTIHADPQRIAQILLNLIGNAVKFTAAGGWVRVALTEEDGFARFTIRDNGVGVSEQDLARIFEPFERSGDAVGLATEGTGLGLPLARDLARLHGGDVVLESAPGAGTTARFSLPLAAKERD
ncbi:MAG: PAS domain-containing sensor histidine kinase [Nitratireductor sp.]